MVKSRRLKKNGHGAVAKNTFQVFTMLLLFLAMHEILEFQAFLYTKRLCAFQVDEVGDDICRYDARFRWYLQCFWILF